MKAIVPHMFRNGTVLDVEHINENLRAIARDINRNLSRRHTNSVCVVDISGMADTDTSEVRTIRLRDPGTGQVVRVRAVELVIYAATGAVWTCAVTPVSGGTRSASLSVTTAGATTKASDSVTQDFAVSGSSSTGISFAFSASAASTITRGFLVLHLCCDRALQNAAATHTDFSPTMLDASFSTAGSVLDTLLTEAATSVTDDATNNYDLRCECFAVRNLGAGSAAEWRIPSGAGRTALAGMLQVVAGGAESVTFAVTSASVGVTGTGTASTALGTLTQASRSDDPTDSADDTTVTLTAAGGTVESAYCFVWWR